MSGPDPKPAPRIKDPDALRRARHPGHDPHHIVRKGSPWFGDDVDDNLITIPSELHRAYHDGDRAAAREIGEAFSRGNIEYVRGKIGVGWADWLMERYRLTGPEIARHLKGVADDA